jgi:hypothetical protein
MDPRVTAGAQAAHADSGVVPEFVLAWADANTKHEGWIPPGLVPSMPRGSVSYRHNNPGNLVLGGKYATFETYELGRAALISDLMAKVKKYPTWTVLQVMERYCPRPDGNPLNKGNDPDVYAAAVAKAMGVTPETQVCNIGMLWDKNGRKYEPMVFVH